MSQAAHPSPVVGQLLGSDEPSIRYRTRTEVLKEPADAEAVLKLRAEIARSPRVASLLSERDPKGRIGEHPYAK